jgi:hypothetical protein
MPVSNLSRRGPARRRARRAGGDRRRAFALAPDRPRAGDHARATRFMVDEASVGGGYVWSALPDFSRRWGELEAAPTMIWVQPPGTGTMGHLFLDAYHATGDEAYYAAAVSAADALVGASIPRAAGTTSSTPRARRACVAGTTPTAGTPGGWRNSSTTTATPPSTTPAPRRRPSSCCGCIWRSGSASGGRRWTRRSASSSTASTPTAAGPSAIRAARRRPARPRRLHRLHHLQRRRGRREHQVPDLLLSDAGRPPSAGSDPARHGLLPRLPAARAPGRLGAAAHADT